MYTKRGNEAINIELYNFTIYCYATCIYIKGDMFVLMTTVTETASINIWIITKVQSSQ